MTWPTFVILGAPRTGTTALATALRQHPQIRMSRVKEPNFFAYGEMTPLPFQGPATAWMTVRVVATPGTYQALYASPPPAAMTTLGASAPEASPVAFGEASVTNFMPRACERLHEYVPNVKLIAILRHPVERAYSQFIHARRMGWEPRTHFGAALAAEANRMAQQWVPPFYYTYFSQYAARLAPYFAAFPRDQIRIYRYEAWQMRPQAVLQDIFTFLGVEQTFQPVIEPHLNSGQLPRPLLQTLVRLLRTGKPWLAHWLPQTWQRAVGQRLVQQSFAPPPPLSLALRRQFMAAYRTELALLETLLDQDFSDWLVEPPIYLALKPEYLDQY